MNLYCDNYAHCNSLILQREPGSDVEVLARAKGWHVFHGSTNGGQQLDSVLCAKCVGPRTQLRKAPPNLSEDVPLF